MEVHDVSHVAALKGLLIISRAQEGQDDTVGAQGRLDDVRDVSFLLLVVKVGHVLAGLVLVLGQVVIGTVRDAPEFAPAEGEEELDIGGRSGIEGKLFLVVVTQTHLFRLHAQGDQPVLAEVLPVSEPFKVCVRLAEEFHFHLLKFSGTEGEVAGGDLVTEGLADLADTERQFLPGGPLDVLEVYKDTLGCLGTQIYGSAGVFGNALEGLEHQVELTDIRPVELAAGRAGNAELVDKAHHFVRGPAVNGAVQCHFVGTGIIFDQLVSAETLAAGLAVHQRIGKAGQMSAGYPCTGVHQDGAVYADVLRTFLHEFLPPCFFYVVLELYAKPAVIPCVGKSAVDLGTGMNKASAVTQRNNLVHCLFHIYCSFI